MHAYWALRTIVASAERANCQPKGWQLAATLHKRHAEPKARRDEKPT